MVPDAYHDYFFACSGAAAAFVGLLFVAISVAPERTMHDNAPVERRMIAINAFGALVNAFFVSIVALIPNVNLGYSAVVLSLAGFTGSLRLGWEVLRERDRRRSLIGRYMLLAAALGSYGFELSSGIQLIQNRQSTEAVNLLAVLVLGFFTLGITRAWQLLGGRSFLFSGRIAKQLARDDKNPPNES